MLGLIGAINGIAPVSAPIIGGFMADTPGWKGIFWVLFILGVILLLGSIHLCESYPKTARQHVSWRALYQSFKAVLHNRSYISYILQFGFSQGVLFANIASAPFIMQQHYGFSPLMFSICFGINALAIVFSAAFSVRFSHVGQVLYFGSLGMFLASVCLCLALVADCSFWIYEVLLIVLLFMVGMTFTASNTLAMESERSNAGMASALLGALGFAFGGLVSPIVGMGNILVSTGLVFLIASGGALLCCHVALRGTFSFARYYRK